MVDPIDPGYHRFTQFIWTDFDKFRTGPRTTPTVNATGPMQDPLLCNPGAPPPVKNSAVYGGIGTRSAFSDASRTCYIYCQHDDATRLNDGIRKDEPDMDVLGFWETWVL